MLLYKVYPESIQPHNTKETFIEEDTREKTHCTQDNDASVPSKVGTLGPHTVLPALLATAANVPSALEAEAVEQILPWHISCQDPAPKSWTQ